METITLEQVYYIGQTVGVVGVFISIIYLAIQLRHNTQALKISTTHDICEGFRSQYALIANNAELAELFVKGLQSVEQLQGRARMQHFAHMHNLCRVYEDAFYQYKRGALDADLWKGMTRQFVEFQSADGFRQYWDVRKQFYHNAFQRFVDDTVLNSKPTESFKLAGT